MKNILHLNNIKDTLYINSNSKFAVFEVKSHLLKILQNFDKKNKIIIICIGTDRATGDSLGPLVGYKLSKLPLNKNIYVYGTLENPVHAKNLEEKIKTINDKYKNKTIIAVDASLGNKNYINHISIGKGSIKPGAGMNKNLPCIGDVFITGIVNMAGLTDLAVLQNTRLAKVMNMAEIISSSLWISLYNFFK